MTTHKTQKQSETNITASSVLDDLNAVAEKITALVGAAPALTAGQIRRATKLRKGGNTVITTMAALAKQYGISVTSHPTDSMVAKMNQATSLVPLHKALVSLTKQVSDAIFQGQSESYASASVHYAMLRRLAEMDGNVATTLQPVSQFFAARSPAVVTAEDAKRGGRKGTKKKPKTSASQSTTATTTTSAAAPGTPGSAAVEPAQTAAPTPAPASATHS